MADHYRYLDTGAISAFGTFRKDIAAVLSCDAICIICLPSFANRMPPTVTPTKNTTANAKPIMPPFRARTNSPQLLIQKFLVVLVHLLNLREMVPIKRVGTGGVPCWQSHIRNGILSFIYYRDL